MSDESRIEVGSRWLRKSHHEAPAATIERVVSGHVEYVNAGGYQVAMGVESFLLMYEPEPAAALEPLPPIQPGSRWKPKGDGTVCVLGATPGGQVVIGAIGGIPRDDFLCVFEPAEAGGEPEPAPSSALEPPPPPDHYTWSGIQPLEVIEAWGMGPAFCLGCVIKYIARWQHKDGLKDLRKAHDYLGKAIVMIEKEAKAS